MPLCEYPDKAGHTPGFILSMNATERESLDFSLIDEAIAGDGVLTFPEDERQAPVSESYRLSCPASITRRDGRLCLTYSESLGGDENGLTDETTEISFDPAEPGLLTVFRSGAADVTLVLESGRRHTCVYHTLYMDFDVCVHTYRVDNSLTDEGGRIYFDYAIELRGAATHRTTMEITVKREEE